MCVCTYVYISFPQNESLKRARGIEEFPFFFLEITFLILLLLTFKIKKNFTELHLTDENEDTVSRK